ncbi:MAG: dihydropteroate synthase [Anaerolineales bacterium]|nr:dihydropteroate synthase [Anaerolineales bacterium]MCK5315646.1 dihydropteroate synthase [Anaerolineales bacterium]
MQTLLRSETKELSIDTNGPVTMIGEKINPTGRKKLSRLIKERDFDYIKSLALTQVEAGADILDVNVGVPGEDEVALLPEVVKTVASAVDVPLCLDSANPEAIAAALAVCPGKPLVNSVNGEEVSLNTVLPIVKEYGAAVIGLTMDDNGIPNDPETRTAIAGKILERAAKIGIPSEDVVIDPLVLTIGADQMAGVVTLMSIELIRQEFGVNINLGASNVSFGLPDRHTINQAFLAIAAKAGASCVITDPVKLGRIIRAVDLLLGRDDFSRRYITYYRSSEKILEKS